MSNQRCAGVRTIIAALAIVGMVAFAPRFVAPVSAHGNVTPQPVDTSALYRLWALTGSTRIPTSATRRQVEIGAAGYLQNCARCHGLEMESGGMAPDLHPFPTGDEGDEIYVDPRSRTGRCRTGQEKMPAFYPIVSQAGLWAIRAYIEANHSDK